jgi:hypothetical protein
MRTSGSSLVFLFSLSLPLDLGVFASFLSAFYMASSTRLHGRFIISVFKYLH